MNTPRVTKPAPYKERRTAVFDYLDYLRETGQQVPSARTVATETNVKRSTAARFITEWLAQIPVINSPQTGQASHHEQT